MFKDSSKVPMPRQSARSWGERAIGPHRHWRLAHGTPWRDFACRLVSLEVSNPLLMAVAAVIGLIAYPLLHPAWVMVH